jgi:hypothetical protein
MAARYRLKDATDRQTVGLEQIESLRQVLVGPRPWDRTDGRSPALRLANARDKAPGSKLAGKMPCGREPGAAISDGNKFNGKVPAISRMCTLRVWPSRVGGLIPCQPPECRSQGWHALGDLTREVGSPGLSKGSEGKARDCENQGRQAM